MTPNAWERARAEAFAAVECSERCCEAGNACAAHEPLHEAWRREPAERVVCEVDGKRLAVKGTTRCRVHTPPGTRPRKPQLVWIVEDVLPYDGSTIVGVYASLEGAQGAHPGHRWRREENGTYSSPGGNEWTSLLLISQHELRVVPLPRRKS